MFVKLQFTQDKHISQVFKILTSIINDATLDSSAELNTLMTSTFTQAQTIAGFDLATSYIYRTGTGTTALTTAKTIARFNKLSPSVYGWNFSLEQTATEDSNTKYITGIHSNATTAPSAGTAGNGIWKWDHQTTAGTAITAQAQEAVTATNFNSATTVGTIPTALATAFTLTTVNITTTNAGAISFVSNTQFPSGLIPGQVVVVSGTNTGTGTFPNGTYYVSVGGTASATLVSQLLPTPTAITAGTVAGTIVGQTFTVLASSGIGTGQKLTMSLETTIRTAWFYVTDNCFIWAISGGAGNPGGLVGVPAGSNLNNTFYSGLHVSMQSSRVDPWNSVTNGISPWITNNPQRGTGLGSVVADLDNLVNPIASNFAVLPLVAATMINAQSNSSSTSWPRQYYWPVNYGAGTIYNEFGGLTARAGADNAVLTADPKTGGSRWPALFKTQGVRWVSADLTKQTFVMLPITWRQNVWNVNGGNLTDKTGVYWFNGDYFPGDTLTYSGETYVLMPLGVCQNDTYRTALAIPRE